MTSISKTFTRFCGSFRHSHCINRPHFHLYTTLHHSQPYSCQFYHIRRYFSIFSHCRKQATTDGANSKEESQKSNALHEYDGNKQSKRMDLLYAGLERSSIQDATILNSLPLHNTIILSDSMRDSEADDSGDPNALALSSSNITSMEVTSSSIILHFSTAKDPLYQKFCASLEQFEQNKGWRELKQREEALKRRQKIRAQERGEDAPEAPSQDFLLGMIPKQIRNLSSLGGGYTVELDRKDFLNLIQAINMEGELREYLADEEGGGGG